MVRICQVVSQLTGGVVAVVLDEVFEVEEEGLDVFRMSSVIMRSQHLAVGIVGALLEVGRQGHQHRGGRPRLDALKGLHLPQIRHGKLDGAPNTRI